MDNCLSDIFGGVPATFWGIMIGSCFTLLGIHLTNRANDKRLKAQFEHELAANNKDRELSLRKGVYLELMEAVTAGLHILGAVADTNRTDRELDQTYIKMTASTSKAQLLAGEDLSKSLGLLKVELGSSYMKLYLKRFALIKREGSLDVLKGSYESHAVKRDEMVDLMTEYNLEGLDDKVRWDTINQNYTHAVEDFDTAFEEYDAMNGVLNTERLIMIQEAVSEVSIIGTHAIQVLIDARNELGIKTDTSIFVETINDITKNVEADAEKFIEGISDLIAKD